MKSKRTWLLLAGLICAALLTLVYLKERDPMHDRVHSKERREWKGAAIEKIQKRVDDPAWLDKELATVKATHEQERYLTRNWLSDDILLFENGEWIAYASHCAKEDARIFDIFIGCGSDGRWYYSTYHFCAGMVVLRMEGRPQSLVSFIQDCSLREFDGHSDECLKQTWPPKTP